MSTWNLLVGNCLGPLSTITLRFTLQLSYQLFLSGTPYKLVFRSRKTGLHFSHLSTQSYLVWERTDVRYWSRPLWADQTDQRTPLPLKTWIGTSINHSPTISCRNKPNEQISVTVIDRESDLCMRTLKGQSLPWTVIVLIPMTLNSQPVRADTERISPKAGEDGGRGKGRKRK